MGGGINNCSEWCLDPRKAHQRALIKVYVHPTVILKELTSVPLSDWGGERAIWREERDGQSGGSTCGPTQESHDASWWGLFQTKGSGARTSMPLSSPHPIIKQSADGSAAATDSLTEGGSAWREDANGIFKHSCKRCKQWVRCGHTG